MPSLKWTHQPSRYWEDAWVCGPYRIIKSEQAGYQAYYNNGKVEKPPETLPCQGCGDPRCQGFHWCYRSLEGAQDACDRHAESTQYYGP